MVSNKKEMDILLMNQCKTGKESSSEYAKSEETLETIHKFSTRYRYIWEPFANCIQQKQSCS